MSFYEVIAFFHGWKQTEIIRNSQNVNIGFGNGPISVSYLLPALLFAPQNSIPSKLEKIVQYNVILISCRYIRYYIMTKPEMARTDSDIIEEYNNDIIIEDMFYPIEARVNPTMMSNNPKPWPSGGYDSGVDSISCKSSEYSSSNKDLDKDNVLENERYIPIKQEHDETRVGSDNQQEDHRHIDIDPDRGQTIIYEIVNGALNPDKCLPKYGWVVVFSCFCLNVIQAGIAFCGGILLHAIAEEFGETRSRVSLISSCFNGFLLCSAPIVERIVNLIGLRITCVSGSFIAAAAFTASIFSTSLNIMIITQGLIAGIGIGLVYFPSIVAPSFYFEENKAIAYGIGICGQGTSLLLRKLLICYKIIILSLVFLLWF